MESRREGILDGVLDTGLGLALYAPVVLAGALPYRRRVPLLGAFASRVAGAAGGYGARALDNLALVAPELPQSEARRVTRGALDNLGRCVAELFAPEAFAARCRGLPLEGAGAEAVERARGEGRPVIFATAHIGNMNAARVALTERGFDMGAFYRTPSNRFLASRYDRAQEQLGGDLYEQGRGGLRQLIRRLQSGGMAAMPVDRSALDGAPLRFFGREARTSLAIAELALRFDALMVPVWGLRRAGGLDFRVVLEAPLAAADAAAMMQEYNDRLEAVVRAHMDQWMWTHRRWKR